MKVAGFISLYTGENMGASPGLGGCFESPERLHCAAAERWPAAAAGAALMSLLAKWV